MSNSSRSSDDFDVELWSQLLGEALRGESRWAHGIYVCSLVVVFFASITGNLLSCIVIYYDKSMHTATNYYLLNLAVSDLIVSFAIWLEIDEHVSDKYQFGPEGCKIHFSLVLLLWNCSILTMTALAIERYIGIFHPMALKSTPVWRRVLKIIALIWMLAIAAVIPEYFTVDLVKITKKSAICFTMPTYFARVLNGILAVVMFLVPLGIMTFVYVMISVKVSNMKKSMNRDKIFNHHDNRSKVNKLIVLTLSFVVCWLPFFTIRILLVCSMSQIMKLKEWFGVVYKVVCFNSWFGVVLNPVLFSLKSTKFRNALKALWNAKVKKKRARVTQISSVITAI